MYYKFALREKRQGDFYYKSKILIIPIDFFDMNKLFKKKGIYLYINRERMVDKISFLG